MSQIYVCLKLFNRNLFKHSNLHPSILNSVVYSNESCQLTWAVFYSLLALAVTLATFTVILSSVESRAAGFTSNMRWSNHTNSSYHRLKWFRVTNLSSIFLNEPAKPFSSVLCVFYPLPSYPLLWPFISALTTSRSELSQHSRLVSPF